MPRRATTLRAVYRDTATRRRVCIPPTIEQLGIAAYDPRSSLSDIMFMLHQQSLEQRHLQPASEDTLSALRTEPARTLDDMCTVCQETETEPGETITVLPCDHRFHTQCVGEWLRQHGVCPNCRATV